VNPAEKEVSKRQAPEPEKVPAKPVEEAPEEAEKPAKRQAPLPESVPAKSGEEAPAAPEAEKPAKRQAPLPGSVPAKSSEEASEESPKPVKRQADNGDDSKEEAKPESGNNPSPAKEE